MLKDFFDIVTGVVEGDTLVPYLFIIFLHYDLLTSIIKKKCFHIKKAGADHTHDLALLRITHAQAESPLHS